MKKTAALLYALCIFLPSQAIMPDDLRRYAEKDGEQMAIFDAMDRAEQDDPDSMDKITYDAYPDGRRVISRQLSYAPKSRKRLFEVFDSLLNIPNPQRFAFKSENSIVYQFGVNDASRPLVINLGSDNTSTLKNVAAITTGNMFTVAQSWTIDLSRFNTPGNFSTITEQFDQLAKKRDSFTKNVTFPIQTSQGGILRLRDNETSPEEKVTGRRVIDTKSNALEWIHTYDLFMEHFGTDENISLTYYRNKRMVTLIDYETKTIYAACFKAETPSKTANGTLIMLIAQYSGSTPYLPSNWTSAN
ncbi:MAG: hypothetical protein K2M05_02615 [Paramuribaculum sp.]|nr:hypothetical protein [Paramuribaculum sp.]MDE6303485.1 hypothetical protein [Paramuribaculum sp.]